MEKQPAVKRWQAAPFKSFEGKRARIDPDSLDVLETVERLMKKRRMSYVDLAYKTATPPSTMYALLNPSRSGYGPLKISTIRKMAEGLDVSIGLLLNELKGRRKTSCSLDSRL